MRKWVYLVVGLGALAIALGSGYFVGEHLLVAHTFGWPILSDAELATFSAAFVCGLAGSVLMGRKLVAARSGKGG